MLPKGAVAGMAIQFIANLVLGNKQLKGIKC